MASGANRNKNLEDDVDDSDGIVMQEGGEAVTLLVQICYKISMWSHFWFKFAIKYRCGHIVGSNLLQNVDVVTLLFKNCLEKNCIFFVDCILGISLITECW